MNYSGFYIRGAEEIVRHSTVFLRVAIAAEQDKLSLSPPNGYVRQYASQLGHRGPIHGPIPVT